MILEYQNMLILRQREMQSDLREKAALLRVLGHPVRLAILLELAAGPKCVTDIQELCDSFSM